MYPSYKDSTHQIHTLCKQLMTFVQGRKMMPCTTEREKKTSEVTLEQGKGKDPDVWNGFNWGINTDPIRSQEGQE